ncbi:hypothetical protein BGZ60DRAFT_66577 [Tricladium varicosporioides]|nr:hypothetical protein BGZ60DRAFT_66577 [Hymenoscyphus varicosporioides]
MRQKYQTTEPTTANLAEEGESCRRAEKEERKEELRWLPALCPHHSSITALSISGFQCDIELHEERSFNCVLFILLKSSAHRKISQLLIVDLNCNTDWLVPLILLLPLSLPTSSPRIIPLLSAPPTGHSSCEISDHISDHIQFPAAAQSQPSQKASSIVRNV